MRPIPNIVIGTTRSPTPPSTVGDVARTLTTQANFARQHSKPQVLVGMRLWKRGFLRRFFKDAAKARLFIDDTRKAIAAAARDGADMLVWSGKVTTDLADGCAREGLTLYRVEDGFLRSAGLGAALIEPVSLALDDLGIYYDPTQESRLERLIADSVDLPKSALNRVAAIRDRMISLKLSKYNLQSGAAALPDRAAYGSDPKASRRRSTYPEKGQGGSKQILRLSKPPAPHSLTAT